MNHIEETSFDVEGSQTWRALLKFVQGETFDELERKAILGSSFVRKLCNFLADKFANISYTVYWMWIIVPYTDNHYDVGCVLKVSESLANYAQAEITKFYATAMSGKASFVAHTNIFILGPPPLEDPTCLTSKLKRLSI